MQNYMSIPNLTNVETSFIGLITIKAANVIRPVSSVLYEASQSTLLKSGFEIERNNRFEDVINSTDCY